MCQATNAVDWYLIWSLEEMPMGDPIEVARLASKVVGLYSQLDSAVQDKEKVEPSVSSLGEILPAANHD